MDLANLRNLPDEELQHLKEISWDDWNFGSGKKLSLEIVEKVEEEQERRKNDVGGRLNWHQADCPPSSPVEGDAFYDTSSNNAYVFDGSNWVQFGGPGV